jgi:rhodanese-related sulfurtransferase
MMISLLLACEKSIPSPSEFDKMAQEMAGQFSAPQVSVSEFKLMLKSDEVQVLDAREFVEYEVSHLQSSIHVGYEDFDLTRVTSRISKDEKCVVYCSVGYRSGVIAEQLIKQGYEAYNLRGGIFGWVNQSQGVYDSAEQLTNKIHGYNQKWSQWFMSGEVVYP